jgi:hypothetical protein
MGSALEVLQFCMGQQVELRKQKREEMLSKRKFTSTDVTNIGSLPESEDDEDSTDECNNYQVFYSQLQQELPSMIEKINSGDLQNQLDASIEFRQILFI